MAEIITANAAEIFDRDAKKRLFDALMDGTLVCSSPWDAMRTSYRGGFYAREPIEIFGLSLKKGDTLTIPDLALH